MTERIACFLLNVVLPISVVDLKAAYRTAAHETHPDKPGGSKEAFVKVKAAYDLLAPLAKDSLRTSAANRTTVEGTPLSDLGRGFPITESARPCKECEGKGFNVFKDAGWGFCPDCRGGFINVRKVRCRKCEGSGIFKRDGIEKGPCYTCKGTGLFAMPLQRAELCRRCNGTCVARVETPTDQFTVCMACKGVGEEKMWNPVIPRGLLALGSKR